MGVSVTAVRRIAIDAQGYAARHRRGTTAEVEAVVRRLSCVQLDSISTVERSHRIAIGARVGAYPARRGLAPARARPPDRVLGPRGMPPAVERLAALPPAMDDGGRRWYGQVDRTHPHLREHVLEEIRARGPARLAALRRRRAPGRDVGLEAGEADARARSGTTATSSSPADRASSGSTTSPSASSRRPSSTRRRRRSRSACATLALRAVHARGALTERGVVEHWRLKGGAARIRATGRLARRGRASSSGSASRTAGADVLVPPGTELDRPRAVGRDPPLAVREPPLGPAVRTPHPRLRPPDRGLQARAAASLRLLRAPVPLA